MSSVGVVSESVVLVRVRVERMSVRDKILDMLGYIYNLDVVDRMMAREGAEAREFFHCMESGIDVGIGGRLKLTSATSVCRADRRYDR